MITASELAAALAAIAATPANPFNDIVAADRRSILIRAHSHMTDEALQLGYGTAGGLALFRDLGSSRYMRAQRIKRLLQVRRWQLAGKAKASRAEFLTEAARIRVSEMLARSAEEWPARREALDASIAKAAEPLPASSTAALALAATAAGIALPEVL